VVVARPYVAMDGGEPLVLAVARPVDALLERYAAAIGAEAVLLNTRGRAVAATDPARWQALDLALPQRAATVTEARRGDRIDAVTAVPLADLAAGSAGLLVTVREETASLAAVDRLTLITVLGTLAALALVLGGLHLYLRSSFRPLDRAVAVLGALSRGDTSVDLRRESDDEIGKIAEAVHSLRGSLATFQDTRRQRDLQRRRQERFVRRQMETLAETLESGAREEVLADLERIVASASDRSDGSAGADPSLRRLIRDDDQLGPLAAVLHQMSGRVVDQHRRLSELVARLREALVRETELASLQQELSIARDLQRSVLPVDFPDRETFAVHCVMESAREVGGDFYDVFDHPDGRIGIVIADVSGKGVPAAFFMAICRTLLKAIALFETDPAVIVRQLNELLSADNDQMMFVTLVFGLFDPATGRLDYVNAGHNPPYRVGSEGAVTALPPSEDMAVAVVEDLGFTGQRLDLAPGDRLVLFTDGVTEAFDPAGAAFGEARLERVLADAAGADPAGIARAMVDAVHAFEAGGDRSDDVTLLILARKAAS
jgi:sigma-B regulation protein RsbU (phosphoserine phosphatase)